MAAQVIVYSLPTWGIAKGDGLGAAEDCWACEHYPGAIQDVDVPGGMGLCDECSALLEAGAQVVKVDDAAADKLSPKQEAALAAAAKQREADAKTMTPAAYREKHGCVAEPPKAKAAAGK